MMVAGESLTLSSVCPFSRAIPGVKAMPPSLGVRLEDLDAGCQATPRAVRSVGAGSFVRRPVAPLAPRRSTRPPLVRAIESGSITEVRAVLDLIGGDARSPLLEPSLDPPLCYAVRAGHNDEILRALLKHGANVNALSSDGQSALAILCEVDGLKSSLDSDSEESWFRDTVKGLDTLEKEMEWCLGRMQVEERRRANSFESALLPPLGSQLHLPMVSLPPLFPLAPAAQNNESDLDDAMLASDELYQRSAGRFKEAGLLKAASVLLAAGADVDFACKRGNLADMARRAGKKQLARFVECYAAAQAFFTLSRCSESAGSNTPAAKLNSEVMQTICGFLLPEGSEATVQRITAASASAYST
eukprot:gb/GFBE01019086.1/.p1 GENE.gb/GFBE01019086.1/~~gb/GFBE01019086.1/.p1  ORF type:complete len:359 (+),score=49.42 gb/GFBE01019086.1/:1-1077(+)